MKLEFRSALIAACVVMTGGFAACGGGTSAQDSSTDVAVADLTGPAFGNDGPSQGAGAPGMPGPISRVVSQCGVKPETTSATLCDRSYPATVHLAWTDCQLAPPSAGADGGAGFGGPMGGSFGGSGGPGSFGGGTPPSSASVSGSIDANFALTLEGGAACGPDAVVDGTRNVKVDITAKTDRGTMSKQMQVDATSSHPLAATTFSEDVSLKGGVSFTRTDGTAGPQVAISGALKIDVDREAKRRTANGTLDLDLGSRGKASAKLENVVRDQTCAQPISGSITRTAPDGTQHLLVFGPDCGSGTLDGQVISLAGGAHP